MQIAKDSVVQFHYSLSNADGTFIETSRGRDPMAALIGRGNIIPGLDTAMLGHVTGDRFEVTVTPEQAYGERREDARQRVPKKIFGKGAKLAPGLQTVLQSDQGPRMITVIKVGLSVVDIDTNHPMAGMTLVFDIEVIDVREATPQERQHGHAHGVGGAQH